MRDRPLWRAILLSGKFAVFIHFDSDALVTVLRDEFVLLDRISTVGVEIVYEEHIFANAPFGIFGGHCINDDRRQKSVFVFFCGTQQFSICVTLGRGC